MPPPLRLNSSSRRCDSKTAPAPALPVQLPPLPLEGRPGCRWPLGRFARCLDAAPAASCAAASCAAASQQLPPPLGHVPANEVCRQQLPDFDRKGAGGIRLLPGVKHQAQPLGAARRSIGLTGRRQALLPQVPAPVAQRARAVVHQVGVVDPPVAPSALNPANRAHGRRAVCGLTTALAAAPLQPPAQVVEGLEA